MAKTPKTLVLSDENLKDDTKVVRKVGRPTKLTQTLIDVMTKVVEDALYWTDEELLDELNEKLEEVDHPTISIDTFKDYKAGNEQVENPLLEEFSTLIKKALRKEKRLLMLELREGKQNWTSQAWIIERKWKEWNLKKLSDATVRGQVTLEDIINKQIPEYEDEGEEA